MLRYMTCCEHPQTTGKKNYPSLMWLFYCSDGHPKAQHWPATAVTTCHTFTESHRGLMTPKQESV